MGSQTRRASSSPTKPTSSTHLGDACISSCWLLDLHANPLGDAGLAALLPALRQLPKLTHLDVAATSIGDEGVASM